MTMYKVAKTTTMVWKPKVLDVLGWTMNKPKKNEAKKNGIL